MLVPFADLIAEATRERAAVGAFTSYELATALGVLAAAEEDGRGVVLLISPGSFRSPTGPALVRALSAVAAGSPVPTCLQLDHIDDLELIGAALELGVGAIMADGSKLALEDNIAFVRAAAERAREHGAQVEAELGRIEGNEDVAAAAAAGALTDPDEAESFVERTGAACLAVSIGNVHGTYASPPQLDWARLDAVREAAPVPLSLHGASGLADDQVRRSVASGVAKVNVNTELRERYVRTLADRLPEATKGARVLELNGALVDAVADVTRQKLALYRPA